MARPALRVIIPRNSAELLKLARLIYTKHTNDGAASPLAAMEDYNWTDTEPKLTEATALQTKVDALRKEAEKIQERIDLLCKDVKGSVTGSRDVLLGVYKKQPKKLGDYGYTVDDTPKAKKDKPAA